MKNKTEVTGHPALLQKLYGAENVLTLRDLLIKLSRSSKDAEHLHKILERPYDHVDYKNLLRNTVCVVSSGAPKLLDGFSLAQTSDLIELLHRAIESLLLSGTSKKNVLCHGYRTSGPSSTRNGKKLYGTMATESYYNNTVTQSLLSPSWELLLSRIGDALFLYLLLHTSMFMILSNDCCLQVSGYSLVNVARGWRRIAPLHKYDDSLGGLGDGIIQHNNTNNIGNNTNTNNTTTGNNINNTTNNIVPLLQTQPTLRTTQTNNNNDNMHSNGNTSSTHTQEQPEKHTAQVTMPTQKKVRPSSWQRRKARKAAANNALESSLSLLPTQEQHNISSNDMNMNTTTNAMNTTQHSDQQHTTTTTVRTTIKNHLGYTQWPRYMQKPSEMIITRAPIFYCSTFPAHPGFPSRHILHALQSHDNAGRILYSSIFYPKNNPVGRSANAYKAMHAIIVPEPDRIPAKHRHIVPLLSSIVRRVARCPFSRLLQLYCPVPRQVRRGDGVVVDDDANNVVIDTTTNTNNNTNNTTNNNNTNTIMNEKSLDSLMDELHQLENNQNNSQQHEGMKRKREKSHLNPHSQNNNSALFYTQQYNNASTTSSIPTTTIDDGRAGVQPPPLKRRRQQTGLARLVLEANSQLMEIDAAVVMSATPTLLIESDGDDGKKDGKESQDVLNGSLPSTQPQSNPINTTDDGDHNDNDNDNGDDVIIIDDGGDDNDNINHNTDNTNNINNTNTDNNQPNNNTNNNNTTTPLASCFVPHTQVARFLWAVVRRILPKQLLGDKRSQRIFQRAIRQFVSLRRFENMSIQQVMQKMKTSSFPWLQPRNTTTNNNNNNDTTDTTTTTKNRKQKVCPPSQAAAHQRMLALWLGWIFSCIIVPLLRAHFYCTESEAYRQQVFYYRKPVWARLESEAVQTLSDNHFAPLPPGRAQQILSRRRLGVARLRLLPKKSGMRFIVNLGRKSIVTFHGPRERVRGIGQPRRKVTQMTFAPVNASLQGVHQILKLEISRQPEMVGSSVFSYNDIYCRFQPFVRQWRVRAAAVDAMAARNTKIGGRNTNNMNNNNTTTITSTTTLAHQQQQQQQQPSSSTTTTTTNPTTIINKMIPHIVSVDVTRAFDHVDVTTLLDLLNTLLQSDEYLVLKYTEVVPSLGDIKVIPRRRAVPANDIAENAEFTARASLWSQTAKGKAYIDGVVYEKIKKADAMALMKQHLTANLVKLKKQWHYQCRGIPQGSTLSTVLCCLYLGHVEKVCLQPLLYKAMHGDGSTVNGGGSGDGVLGSTSHGYLTGLASAAAVGHTTTTNNHHGIVGIGGIGVGGQQQFLSADAHKKSMQNNNNTSKHAQLPSQYTTNTTTTRSATIKSTQPPPSQQQQLQQQPCALFRLIDDWLLITYDRKIAESFAQRLLRGITRYNIFVNPDKSKLSFPLQLPDSNTHIAPALYTTDDGSKFIKWCGVLLNVDTLEIQGDYTRYAGEHINTSLTVPYQKNPGTVLGQKLCHYLRPKVHPLLLDPTINSPRTVCLNIYQAFSLAAMKFHCYIRALPSQPTSRCTYEAIEAGIKFMMKLTRPRRVAASLQSIHEQNKNAVVILCDTSVPLSHVRYLGLYAFQNILKRKQSMYVELLKLLDEALNAPCCARCAHTLEEVVDPRRSSMFDHIIY